MQSWFWKCFGAMITENKNGEMALSFTRFLGLVTFLPWLTLEVLHTIGYVANAPSMTFVGVLGSLIGIKGVKDVAKAITGRSAYTDPE